MVEDVDARLLPIRNDKAAGCGVAMLHWGNQANVRLLSLPCRNEAKLKASIVERLMKLKYLIRTHFKEHLGNVF